MKPNGSGDSFTSLCLIDERRTTARPLATSKARKSAKRLNRQQAGGRHNHTATRNIRLNVYARATAWPRPRCCPSYSDLGLTTGHLTTTYHPVSSVGHAFPNSLGRLASELCRNRQLERRPTS